MEKSIATGQRDYEKASRLLGKLFNTTSDITEQIDCCIRHNGVGEFFENLEAFDFSGDVLEKLKAVKTILVEMDVKQKEAKEAMNHNEKL